MAKCYPSIARKYPDTPEQLRKTLMESIRKRVIADLEDFYADLNLKANLDLVDRLEAEQRTLSLNERVWYRLIRFPTSQKFVLMEMDLVLIQRL